MSSLDPSSFHHFGIHHLVVIIGIKFRVLSKKCGVKLVHKLAHSTQPVYAIQLLLRRRVVNFVKFSSLWVPRMVRGKDNMWIIVEVFTRRCLKIGIDGSSWSSEGDINLINRDSKS